MTEEAALAALALQACPQPASLQRLAEPQICYVLLTITARMPTESRSINWAVVVDTSRSMRVPMVDEAQFRALVQHASVQETLLNGVPVWQLSRPLPPDIRAAARSPLDYIAAALGALGAQLSAHDHLVLVVATQPAQLVARASGTAGATLQSAIAQLHQLESGAQTDLASGITLALDELRRGRSPAHAARLLILTDGFVEQPGACRQMVAQATAAGVAVSVLGLGGELAEHTLHALAEPSGTPAVLLPQLDDITRVLNQELRHARASMACDAHLHIALAEAVQLRRATRTQPALTLLAEHSAAPLALPLGDLSAQEPTHVLLELLVLPCGMHATRPLAHLTLAAGTARAACALTATYQPQPPRLPPALLDAAARATAARLRAHERCAR